MTDFFAWFERSRRKSSDRSWRGRHRLLLALEILEPRQMLAADGLGGFVPMLPTDHVCAQVCDGVVIVPSWNAEQAAPSDESGGLFDSDGPARIHLDQLAEEIGEVFEIEDQESWWLDAE